jgi:glycine/D-amino acid oxidase-like deaminating enzyme
VVAAGVIGEVAAIELARAHVLREAEHPTAALDPVDHALGRIERAVVAVLAEQRERVGGLRQ